MEEHKSKKSAPAAPNQEVARREIDELDQEIREIELETKRIELEEARARVGKFKEDKASKEEKRARAQRSLDKSAKQQRDIHDACYHATGGFGLDDTYTGDGPAALVVTELPLAGRKYVLCVRCLKDWTTPNPALKKSDPALYGELIAEWKEVLILLRKAKSRAIGVPSFSFESEDGTPVHPTIL